MNLLGSIRNRSTFKQGDIRSFTTLRWFGWLQFDGTYFEVRYLGAWIDPVIRQDIGGSLGKMEGDEVEIVTPSGTKDYEMRSLRTIHDMED